MTTYEFTTKWCCVWLKNGNVFAIGFDEAQDAARYGRLAAGNNPTWTVQLRTYREA